MNIINIKIDKMRYQKNASSYFYVIISLVLSIIALFTLINYDTFSITTDSRVVPDFRVGLEIVVGIITMMTTFLAAEKVKLYDPFWSRNGLFILAGINVLRTFSLPLYSFDKGWIPTSLMTTSMVLFAASACLLVIAGMVASHKVSQLKHHLKELRTHGNDDA